MPPQCYSPIKETTESHDSRDTPNSSSESSQDDSHASSLSDNSAKKTFGHTRQQWMVLMVISLATLSAAFSICLFPPFYPRIVVMTDEIWHERHERTSEEPVPFVFAVGRIVNMLASSTKSLTEVATLLCSGKNILCSKAVLQISSDVFMAMFTAPIGIVEMDDVNGDMMQVVVDYYNTGLLPEISDIVHEDLQYIITKYNFVGMKEAFADKILREVSVSGKAELAEFVLFYYGNAEQKDLAIRHLATVFLIEKRHPDFVLDLDPPDFLKLVSFVCHDAKKYIDPPGCVPFEFADRASEQIFLMFRQWLQKDPDSRSDIFIAVLNLIDMRRFSWKFIMQNVATLPLKQDYQLLLGWLEAPYTKLNRDGYQIDTMKIFSSLPAPLEK